jgi:hypothetical protein
MGRVWTGITKHRARGAQVWAQFVQSACVAGSAFGFGALAGYFGSVDVYGIPVDAGAGILLNLAGYAGLGGPYSKLMHDVGDGALAAYTAKLGAHVGDGQRRKRPMRAHGERMLSSGERRRVSAGEVAAMAMSQRA